MAAPEVYCVVVVGPNGKRHEPREERLDIDDRDELRDALIRIARSEDSYRSGSALGGEWVADWRLEAYTQGEASKGTYAGGWGRPEKTASFPR